MAKGTTKTKAATSGPTANQANSAPGTNLPGTEPPPAGTTTATKAEKAKEAKQYVARTPIHYNGKEYAVGAPITFDDDGHIPQLLAVDALEVVADQ